MSTITPIAAIKAHSLDQSKAVEYGRRVLREKLDQRHTSPEVRPAIRRIITRLREIQ